MHPTPKIRTVFKILGVTGLALTLLLAGMIVNNYRALMKTQNFIDSVVLGESRERVLSRAESQGGTVVLNTTGSSALILFRGFVFAHADCRIDFENQRVIGKEIRGLRD